MTDPEQQKNVSTAIVRKTNISLNWGPDSGYQGKIATMLVQNTPTEIRLEKVIEIQHLLAQAGQKLDKQQNAVLKQLLEDLNT